MSRLIMPIILAALVLGCDARSNLVDPVAVPTENAAGAAGARRAVDLSKLEPALSSNFTWKCHFERQDEPVCIGSGPSTDNTNGWIPADPEAWVCQGGILIYHNLTVQGKAVRRYDSDYHLVDRTVHWVGRDRYSLKSDGAGKTASGESNFKDEFMYGVPADEATVTEVISGTDSKAAPDQPPHTLLFLNKGEVKFSPDGNLTVLSGRWDFVTDFEGAI
jgi:hypothetical protein